jgi:hypothetical protein
MVEKERYLPVINRKYPLYKIVGEYKYAGTGQKIGNVINTMGNYYV